MKIRKLIEAVASYMKSPGEEKQTGFSSPLQYKNDSFTFLYPAEWRITKDTENEGEYHVLIETSGDALIALHVLNAEDAVSLEEFANWSSQTLKEETAAGSFGDSEYFWIERDSKKGANRGIREQIPFTLMGEAIPHVKEYFLFELGEKVAYLDCQSAEEDYQKVEPGFDLIHGTLSAQ